MSKIAFQGKVQLTAAVYDQLNDVWICTVHFVDLTGRYSVVNIYGLDVLLINTSQTEVGTFTFYNMTSLSNIDTNTSTFETTLQYSSINDNIQPPPLTDYIGQDAILCRIIGNKGLLTSPSTSIQGVGDSFMPQIVNYNLNRIEQYSPPPNRYDICIYEPGVLALISPSLLRTISLYNLELQSPMCNAICTTPPSTQDTTIGVKVYGNYILNIIFRIGQTIGEIIPLEVGNVSPYMDIEVEVFNNPDPDLAGVSILIGFQTVLPIV